MTVDEELMALYTKLSSRGDRDAYLIRSLRAKVASMTRKS